MTIAKYSFPFLMFLLLPDLANAQEHIHGVGFQSGLSHPVLGLDHLLAMVAVGVVSAQIGGRAIWTVPAAFVLTMAFGGALGLYDVPFLAVEIGIALSVIVLGFTIAAGAQISLWLLYSCIALFAIFHGYAHGQEIPELASSWSYILGFMLATAGLHLVGVLIGYLAEKIQDGETILRYTGAMVAGIGVHILAGLAGY